MFEDSTSTLISSFSYSLALEVEIDPERYFVASVLSLTASISYQESTTAQSVTYSLDCDDTFTLTACDPSLVSFTFEISDGTLNTASDPVQWDGVNKLTVYTTDAEKQGSYSYVVTAKMFGVTSGTLIETLTYNMAV